MRLFCKGKKIDVQKRIEGVGQAYGCKHPERITGFAGFFLRGDPDIFVSDELDKYLTENPAFSVDLMELVKKYNQNDFGILPKDEAEGQLEDIYCFGNTSWNKGIYETSIGVVVYELFYDEAFFYLPDEQEQADQYRDRQKSKTK